MYLPDGVFVDGWTMQSKPDYVQNAYRPSGVTSAEAVSDALLKRLENRFPPLFPAAADSLVHADIPAV